MAAAADGSQRADVVAQRPQQGSMIAGRDLAELRIDTVEISLDPAHRGEQPPATVAILGGSRQITDPALICAGDTRLELAVDTERSRLLLIEHRGAPAFLIIHRNLSLSREPASCSSSDVSSLAASNAATIIPTR